MITMPRRVACIIVSIFFLVPLGSAAAAVAVEDYATATGAPLTSIEGRLRVFVIDYLDGRHGFSYEIEREVAGKFQLLPLQGDTSGLAPGQHGMLVRVKGEMTSTGLVILSSSLPSVTVLGASDDIVGADGLNPENFGLQDLLGLLTNFQNDATTPVTVAAVVDVMQTNGNKLFKEFSWNQMWVNTTVPGYHTAAMSATCSQGQITQPAVDAADPDVDYTNIDRITFIFNKNDCSYGGVAQLGKRNLNTDEGTIRVSLLWIPSRSWGVGVWAHEKGHNYGVLHGSYLNCNGGNPSTTDLTTCTAEEYGDPWDNMGSAGGRMHYSSSHKRKIGWLKPNQSELLSTKVGTRYIQPLEKMVDSTLQGGLAEVRIPYVSAELTFEYRTAFGYDAGKTGNLYQGVVVHGTWSESGGGGGSDSHLVDFAPSGTSKTDSALVPGQIYKDTTRNIEVVVIQVTPQYAVIRFGPPSNDTVPPDVIVTTPADGTGLPSTTVPVAGTASDNMGVLEVSVNVNGGNWVKATGTTSWTAQVTVPAGTSTICARAIDTAGNAKTSTLCPKVTIDTAPPVVAITSPADGFQATQTDIPVSGTSSDDTNVAKVELSVNTGAWTLATGTTTWSGTVTLSEGGNNICARATDGANKTSPPKCVNVGYDKTPPTVLIAYPADNAVLNLKDIIAKGTATDNQGVVSVAVQIGGGAWTPANGTTSWQIALSLAEGANQICAQSTDKAGLKSPTTPCTKVTLDTTPPDVAFTAPSPGANVPAEALVITGTAKDNIGILRVELRIAGGSWFKAQGTDPWTTWTATVNLPAAGANEICARGVDTGLNIGSGNTCVTVTSATPRTLEKVTIDPASIEVARGEVVHFTAQALDADGQPLPANALAWKWVRTEGSGEVTQDGTFTAPRTVGRNRISVTATFDTGSKIETKTAFAVVNVKSDSDIGGLLGSLAPWLALAIIAVVALVAVAMVLRRRRKGPQGGRGYWDSER